MTMARTSKNLGFTVPPRMAEEFERVAAEEGSTKSELFRRMFRLYQSYRTPRRAEEPGVWAERLIMEAQQVEREQPMSAQEFSDEIERATRY
jgi:metal-responsive CopG/Arc/MetJ family transcriptional regulator